MHIKNLYYYEFIIFSILEIISAEVFMKVGMLSQIIMIMTVILTTLFFLFSFFFIILWEKKVSKIYGFSLDFLFSVGIIIFISIIFIKNSFTLYFFYEIFKYIDFIWSFPLFLLTFFLIFFGAYLIRTYWKLKKKRKFAFIGIAFIFAALILLIIVFILFPILGISANDETVISIAATNSFMNGHNPYNTSISQYVYLNQNKYGATLTTKNNVIGKMAYPSLFFLSSLPFYLASNINLYNIKNYSFNPEILVFVFMLLLVVAFAADKKKISKPIFGLMILLNIEIAFIASLVIYLMLAMLIISYVTIDKRYSFLILGITASFQQELWIPIIFLVVYLFKNYGFKRTAYTVLGTIVVFLIINGYFIALGPRDFINAVFLPLNSYIFPNSLAQYGYYLIIAYHIAISSLSYIFYLIIALFSIILFKLNNKRIIGILSLAALLFLQKAVASYYIFFIMFSIILLFIPLELKHTEHVKKDSRNIYYSIAAILIVLLCIIILYFSHLQYESAFNISVSNQTINFNKNYTVYTANMEHFDLKNNSVYVELTSFSKYTLDYYEYSNSNCSPQNYSCFEIQNLVEFKNDSNRFDLKSKIPCLNSPFFLNYSDQTSNTFITTPVYALNLLIYNGEYLYEGPLIYNSSIKMINECT
jgi:hypothetical protein